MFDVQWLDGVDESIGTVLLLVEFPHVLRRWVARMHFILLRYCLMYTRFLMETVQSSKQLSWFSSLIGQVGGPLEATWLSTAYLIFLCILPSAFVSDVS